VLFGRANTHEWFFHLFYESKMSGMFPCSVATREASVTRTLWTEFAGLNAQ
jgi:hypothetical protein